MLDPIIHTKLEKHYQKAYQLLCQPEEPECLAIELLIALKQSLDAYGDPPLQLLERITQRLNSQIWESENDRHEMFMQIDTLAHETDGNTRAIGLIVRTVKGFLSAWELEAIEKQKKVFLALLMRRYLWEIYVADCKIIMILSLSDETMKQQVCRRFNQMGTELHYIFSLLRHYAMRKITKMPPNSDQSEGNEG